MRGARRAGGTVLLGVSLLGSTVIGALATPLQAAEPAAAGYDVIELGTLGGPRSMPADISENGWVTGWADDADGVVRPFRWAPASGTVALTTPDGIGGEGWHINDIGQVLGRGDDEHVVIWAPDGTPTVLADNLSADTVHVRVLASELTEAGVAMWVVTYRGPVVSSMWSTEHGWVYRPANTTGGCSLTGLTEAGMGYGLNNPSPDPVQDCLMSVEGTIQAVPLSPFPSVLIPWRLADDGTMIGAVGDNDAQRLATSDLRTATVQPVPASPSARFELAPSPAAHQVAVTGSVGPPPGTHSTAFWWDVDAGTVTALPSLGGISTTAVAANASGAVIGRSQAADGSWHGVLWGPDHTPVDLDAIAGGNFTPVDIDGTGDIVGYLTAGGAQLAGVTAAQAPAPEAQQAVLLRVPRLAPPTAPAPAPDAITPAFTG